MAITKFTPHTAMATGTTGAATLSVPAPASLTAGELSWLIVAVKPQTATITPDDAAWQLALTATGGTGTTGADTGPTKLAYYYRFGSYTGNQTVSVSGGNVCWGQIEAYSKSASLAWDFAVVSGDDTTGGSALYDATCTSDPGWVTGDVPLATAVIPTDAHTGVTALGLNATGIAGGAVNAYRNADVTTGNQIGGVILDRIGGTGTATTNPQVLCTFTGATNTYGPCIVARMREIAGGQNVAINQVTETDTVLSLAELKTRLLNQVTVVNSAQAFGRRKASAVAQVTVVNTAQALGRRKSRTAGLVAETDTALLLGRRKSRAAALVAEADTAQSLARRKTLALGLVTTLATAQPIGVLSGHPVAQAVETDTARPLVRVKARMLGQVTETNTARPVGARKALELGQVAEFDTAQPLVSPVVSVRREYWGMVVLR